MSRIDALMLNIAGTRSLAVVLAALDTGRGSG